jgi:hypothetical protein
MGRREQEVLAAGAPFTLGVFLTYLGVGAGVLTFLAALPFPSAVGRWGYGLTAALCLLLAVGSLYDWWQARRGKHDEMCPKLPTRLRRWINRTVREGAGMRAFVSVTFVTGVVISVIELACTGQVYLPIILFVLGVPELALAGRAVPAALQPDVHPPTGGGLCPGLLWHHLTAVGSVRSPPRGDDQAGRGWAVPPVGRVAGDDTAVGRARGGIHTQDRRGVMEGKSKSAPRGVKHL